MKTLALGLTLTLSTFLFGCGPGYLRPDGTWRELDKPPVEINEIAADLGRSPERLLGYGTWYAKGDNEYLLYTPASGDGTCNETELTVIKVDGHWKKESERGYICVD